MDLSERVPRGPEESLNDGDTFVDLLEAQGRLNGSEKESPLSNEEALERIRQILTFDIPNQERLIEELTISLREALDLKTPKCYQNITQYQQALPRREFMMIYKMLVKN
jgi:hypothetical protein